DGGRQYSRGDPHALHQYLRSSARLELLSCESHRFGLGRNRFCAAVARVFVESKTMESMATTVGNVNVAVNKTVAAALQVGVRLSRVSPTERFDLDVSFRVDAGITILFGASGVGKTTLLDCIAGLQTPDSGEILLAERVLFDSGK